MATLPRRTGLIAALVALCAAFCAKDYNPFENPSNARVIRLPDASSAAFRTGDTASIFTTETLAVATAVRERIDSVVVSAEGNRFWKHLTVQPPFENDYKFLFSYPGAGMKKVAITVYHDDGSVFRLDTITLQVKSPLKQKDIFAPLGVYTLETVPVGDPDVYYFWALDTVPGDTFKSPFASNRNPPLRNFTIGKKLTGSLWVEDTSGRYRSPAAAFSFEFYKPSPPHIECLSKGLRGGDSVVTSDTIVVFSVKVLDSSGSGLTTVDIDGSSNQITTADSVVFSKVISGMKSYSSKQPKSVTVRAINRAGDTATATYYCFYDASGVKPEYIRLYLINPTASLTTTLTSVFFTTLLTNVSHDSMTVSVLQNNQTVATKKYGDSIVLWYRDLELVRGANVITASASIPGVQKVDTTITIISDPAYRDTTAPSFLAISINNVLWTQNPFTVADTVTALQVKVSVFDNESGVDSVTVAEVGKLTKPTVLQYNAQQHVWISANIPFLTATGSAVTRTKYLSLVAKNKAGLRTPAVPLTISKKQ
jgi:hypothetical protein